MADLADPRLTAWQSFYVVIGSSGAALVGVQFVVITLVAALRRPPDAGAIHAFATPTVVHFAFALLISAIMSAPWRSLLPPSVALVLSGVAGLAYATIVIRRARRQTDYSPVWEDWLWYAALPSSAYAAVALSAVFLRSSPRPAMFVIAAATLALLLIGIHNAWDSVTHIVIRRARDDAASDH